MEFSYCFYSEKEWTSTLLYWFRKVNSISIKDAHLLPNILRIRNKPWNSEYFSTLDLKSGYWEILIHENSRDVTTFTVPKRGLFRFKVLRFGWHSGGATFQRYLDKIIDQELGNTALVWFAHIIVLGRTFDNISRI